MAQLKGTEKFVAERLQSYFSNSFNTAVIEEGDDPPDIYLKINDKKIGVEITDIDENVLKNRKTIDYGYLNFIDNIDKEFGHLIDADKRISLYFHHYYVKVSAISKEFKNYLKSLINSGKLKVGNSIEDNINDVNFKILIVPMPKSETRKIVGFVMPFGGKVKKSRDINTDLDTMSAYHLAGQTLNIVLNRIHHKNIKCKNIEKPIWLALFDNYYNKFTHFDNDEHLEHYKNTFDCIEDFGIFEKIFVIFENGDFLEFST